MTQTEQLQGSDAKLADLGNKISDRVPMSLDQGVEIGELGDLIDGLHEAPSYHVERIRIEFSTRLAEIMQKEGVSKKELAKRLGKSTGFVGGVLAGSKQTKIRHMVEVVMALGYRLKFEIVKPDQPHHYLEPTERK